MSDDSRPSLAPYRVTHFCSTCRVGKQFYYKTRREAELQMKAYSSEYECSMCKAFREHLEKHDCSFPFTIRILKPS